VPAACKGGTPYQRTPASRMQRWHALSAHPCQPHAKVAPPLLPPPLQDIVERLHLVAILMFVVIEDMDSSGTWRPSRYILKESLRILGSEVGGLSWVGCASSRVRAPADPGSSSGSTAVRASPNQLEPHTLPPPSIATVSSGHSHSEQHRGTGSSVTMHGRVRVRGSGLGGAQQAMRALGQSGRLLHACSQ